MEVIVTLVTALPLGFVFRSRIAGYVAYIAVHTFAFTFQSLNLLIDWVGGSEEAFGPYPDANTGDVLAYGAVNGAIYLVGFGLVTLGYRARIWRQARRPGTVSLDPVR